MNVLKAFTWTRFYLAIKKEENTSLQHEASALSDTSEVQDTQYEINKKIHTHTHDTTST